MNYKHELANAEMTINMLLYILNQWYEQAESGSCDDLLKVTGGVIDIAKRDGRI